MRLYVTTRGSWAGTQDDAKALAKAEGGTWELSEVPVDKASLLGFLNAHKVGACEQQSDGLSGASHDTGSPGHSGKPEGQLKPAEVDASVHAAPAGAKPLHYHENYGRALQVAHDCDIEEAIGRADLRRTINLTDHVFSRLREHVDAARALEGARQ
ncbi:hypothetical protein [Sphingomonas asaccharolytica]|uniref:hypothetical protein n=1 Tax=Sphingomonas asaccharolytica TaxID=40681 RepID=UPI00082A25AF|nr:hypothetical protein [Sphingomonas asaccharolytica]